MGETAVSRQKGSRILFCVAPSGPFREKVPGTFLPCRPPVKRVTPPLSEPTDARAFTLVELVTVMGILAILVTLIVGAAQGLHDRAARETTIRIMAALDAALQRYYDDWGKFPWYRDETDADLAELLGAVAGHDPRENAIPNYCPVKIGTTRPNENQVEAMLYAALNMREREGPYMSGGAGNVKVMRLKTEKYQIYVDGWGRPIHYFQPQTDHNTNKLVPVPLLMSEGRTADFFIQSTNQGDTWPDKSKADNLTNYDLDAMGVNRLEIDDPKRKY